MGTIIKSVGTALPVFDNGILSLTCHAIKRCLKKGKISVKELGMILYCGVYNENHQGEPALASLIQNRIQRYSTGKRLLSKEAENIFSFDIHNGGGGILDAFNVADSFIASGNVEYCLVVAGDTKPVKGLSQNYHYFPSAGAVLLSNEPEGKGFRKFVSKTYTAFKNDFNSSTNWETGNFRFITDQKPEYLEDCLRCAEDATKTFLEDQELSPDDIDLLISSRSPLGFREKFIKRNGFKDILTLRKSNHEIFSAGLVFSLNKMVQEGVFNVSKNILFLTVGSGITVSLSLYRNQ